MHRIAYYRVSTRDQSIASQRLALGGSFDQEFKDEGISGGTLATSRPGFADLLGKVRKGDEVHVYAVDRLGRDALDVQSTVRHLIDLGATVHVHGLGAMGRGVGEIILAVLAQVADMERRRIAERTEAGRSAARASLEANGRTHRGKTSLGRPVRHSAADVASWRETNKASIRETAAHFDIAAATVKRYLAQERGEPDPLTVIEDAAEHITPVESSLALSPDSELAKQIKRLRASTDEATPVVAQSTDHDPLTDA